MEDEESKAIYKWEKGINATWETVQEDEQGNIIQTSMANERERSLRAKKNRITQSIRRGLIRYMVVAIDCSSSAGDKDYRPSRMEVSKGCVSKFIIEYFDQNPISQLSIGVTRDRVAEKITDLSGNSKIHVHKLQEIVKLEGLASLQNTIILAMNTLRHIPGYGHRELLIVFSSLSTCDPGDIFKTIKDAKAQKIRISIICLAAEIFICKQICEITGGIFAVAVDATHLSELLLVHTVPPPEIQQKETFKTDFIYMGFPKRVFSAHATFCFDGTKTVLSENAYVCPRCYTRATDIPTQCCVCRLQLNSSSHIARSYHHLFPVDNYLEYVVRHEGEDQYIAYRVVDNSSALALHTKEKGETVNCTSTRDGSNSNRKQQNMIDLTNPADSHNSNNNSNKRKFGEDNDPADEAAESKNGQHKMSQDSTEATSAPQSESVTRCTGCRISLCADKKTVLRCVQCSNFFCVECDIFIHDSLHNCPGCSEKY